MSLYLVPLRLIQIVTIAHYTYKLRHGISFIIKATPLLTNIKATRVKCKAELNAAWRGSCFLTPNNAIQVQKTVSTINDLFILNSLITYYSELLEVFSPLQIEILFSRFKAAAFEFLFSQSISTNIQNKKLDDVLWNAAAEVKTMHNCTIQAS